VGVKPACHQGKCPECTLSIQSVCLCCEVNDVSSVYPVNLLYAHKRSVPGIVSKGSRLKLVYRFQKS